jgi:hypothetical protein
MRKRFSFRYPKRSDIDDETREVGVGPLNLDVTMARGHGWTEKAIKRTADLIQKIAKRESAYARRRHPERYEDCNCGDKRCKVVVFLGHVDDLGRWTRYKRVRGFNGSAE